MHRFFIPPENLKDDRVTIRGSDVNHIRNVLRMKVGDRALILDGRGNQFVVEMTRVTRDQVEADILSRDKVQVESPVRIVMGQALIKGNRFDNLVRKSVELGVSSIVPLNTRRCVARLKKDEEKKKIQRWQKIVKEASQQCGRTAIPEVAASVISLEVFCDRVEDCDLKLLFWECETERKLADVQPKKEIQSIAFAAGPEGGWAPEEVDALRHHGFETVGLGPRTLRADSASLVILSLLQHRWGDL